MSWFSSGIKSIGKIAETAAPLANFIPGVGPAVAAGIGGLGGLAAGDGIMGGVKGALGGYLGGALPGAGGIDSTTLGGKALSAIGLGGMTGGLGAAGTAGAGATNGGWSDPTGGVMNAAGFGSAAGAATGAAGAAGAAQGASGGLLGWLERNPALASAGASLIGNTVGGIGQGQIASANRAEQQREFNLGYGLNANQQAMAVNRAAQASPLRDQAQYLLQQRLGLTPQAFQPHDMYNPSVSSAPPQTGGINLAQYAQRAQQYQPGMGGQSNALQQGILQKLGYGAGASGGVG